MSLADRLRGIVRPASELVRPAASLSPSSAARDHDRAAEVLGGEWHDAGAHRFLVVDRKYSPGHRHGHVAIADAAPGADGWPRLPLLMTEPGGPSLQRVLFLDLETTGLAGGAGTYAFLVGCASFEGATFRIRQFFLSSYGAERLMLEAVAGLADECDAVVTYNGKSFDLPVMDTRYVMNRMATPFAEMPHVDMLHPARRLWRPVDDQSSDLVRRRAGEDMSGASRSDGGCRLSVLEGTICGHTREGDVPGFEIPARYFNFVRSGDARPLDAVFEHNRLDLISLALITARAVQLLDDGAAATRTAREALGLGRLYERAGMTSEARAAFVRACAFADADVVTRAESLRALAVLCRRERRHHDAAEAWRQILDLRRCPPPILREAAGALAVHHEHRLRDPQSARGFALRSLQLPHSAARRGALQHRLARLNRKLGAGDEPAPLF